MIGPGNPSKPLAGITRMIGPTNTSSVAHGGVDELCLRVQKLSLREQIERNHFLLERLNASSARLLQSLDRGDAYEAIAEIIANLIGSEEVAIFHYRRSDESFSLAWSHGVEGEMLGRFGCGAGMLGRVAHEGVSQFRERQADHMLLPHEKNLTACVVLKSGEEVLGAVAVFNLLPQKSQLEWADFELLKFLEVYGAVAIQYQRLQGNR